ncbi:MAG: M23 family metallopeptidase [Verrucomicrobiota bacterium]
MNKSASAWLPLVIVALLAAGVIVLVRRQAVDSSTAAQKFAPRLHQLSPWEMAAIPQALTFESPAGSASGALVYNAQKFWEMNAKRGGHHTGDDLNGIGGMNSDFGDPVFAAADGLVIYAAEPSTGWGNVVIIAHRAKDGRLLQTMYAHLDSIATRRGALVARGARIGTFGTAHGNYPAHLHFEIRETAGVEIGGGYLVNRRNLLNPADTVESLRAAPADRPAPSPLATVVAPNP